MKKMFLVRNSDDRVHGVDYDVGVKCGRVHEFMTRDCKPILLTEEDAEVFASSHSLVEVTPFK